VFDAQLDGAKFTVHKYDGVEQEEPASELFIVVTVNGPQLSVLLNSKEDVGVPVTQIVFVTVPLPQGLEAVKEIT
jgi:hypothetical protein